MSAYFAAISEFASKHRTPLAVAGSCLAVGYLVVRFLDPQSRYRKKTHAPRKQDFKEDVVYLYTFPPLRSIISISPYAIKVEAWLRMQRIPHEVIREGGVKYWSDKGQIPFVELNGKEINDSGVIIQELASNFGKFDNLPLEQQGFSHGLARMLDNHTSLSYFYYRYVEVAQEFSTMWTFVPAWSRKVIAWRFPGSFRKRAFEHGIGRNPPKEIYELGCQDFKAMSKVLGGKKYLIGDQMTSLDCALFGHLSQVLYIPLNYPHTAYLRENCVNLIEYCDRIKTKLFPDWDNICGIARE